MSEFKSTLDKKYIFLFLILFILLNYPRLLTHPYNLEWVFIELSKYFNDNSYYFNIDRYKIWQANPTFYSLIISFLNKINFFFSDYFLPRFLNLIGVSYCATKFFYSKFLDYKIKTIIVISLLINPIFTVFIFRVYPDILSLVLFYLSIIFFYEKKYIFIFICLLLSVFLKPVAILYSPIFILSLFYLYYQKLSEFYFREFIYILFTPVVVIILYIFFVRYYEISLFSEKVGLSYLKFSFYNSLTNFFRYFIYIFLISLPFLIFPFYSIYKKTIHSKKYYLFLISLIFTLLIVFTFNINSNYGELSYGFLDALINLNPLLIQFFIVFNICFFLTFSFITLSIKQNKFLILSIFFILILSLFIFRPAQRYVMYIYPFFLLYIFSNYEINFTKILNIFLSIFLIVLFFSVSIIQFNIQKKKISLFEDAILFINNNDLSSKIYPEILLGSHGYFFDVYLKNVKDTESSDGFDYQVISNNCDQSNIYIKSYKFFLYQYEICIIKN